MFEAELNKNKQNSSLKKSAKKVKVTLPFEENIVMVRLKKSKEKSFFKSSHLS